METTNPLRKYRLLDCLEIALVLFSAVAAGLLLELVLPLLNGLSASLLSLIINAAIHTVWALAAIIACVIRKVPVAEGLGISREQMGRQLLLGFAVFSPIMLIIGIIITFVNRTSVLTAAELVYHLIRMMIFVGFSEEFVFRGYLLGKLKRMGCSDKKAIVWSSAIFGFIHILNPGFPVGQVVIAFIIGLFFAFVIHRFKDCTTLTTGVAHGLTNSFSVILAFLYG